MELKITKKELGGILDHTLLKSFATRKDIEKLCKEAKSINAASVCINESYVKLAKKFLKDSNVKVCCVIGFPLGATTTEVKAFSAKDSFNNGADEVDMVINQAYLLDNLIDEFTKDIEEIVKVAKEHNKILKVIIETCYLNKKQISTASKIIADLSRKYDHHLFVKTSTGFGTGGATVEDVELIRKVVGDYSKKNKVGIKAAGGVKDAETVIKMIWAAGCVDKNGNIKENLKDIIRIGTSSGVKIIENFDET